MNDIKLELGISKSEMDKINKRMKAIVGKEIKLQKCSEDFREVKKIYIIPGELFNDSKKINDVIRYKIKIVNKIIEYKIIEIEVKDKESLNNYINNKKILIINESPHKEEFTFNYEPIGPAQGRTGSGIEKNLNEIINLFNIENGEFILIISNPVQFQASLGTFYFNSMCDTIRNNLWTKLFNKEEYLERLKSYNADYIVIATTSNRTKRINKVVEKYKEYRNEIKVETTYHPSTWSY